ncbi:hypothetical protein BDN70DRAFT_703332 [Pholiota conissans]|uniref:Uncharacterized protein n=1 Tax=Pholiota conissans TaxID=109636 RepID=A0A9P5Z0J1_9AGAR|nr:hypothetical protein BDN70DRAFT_703332 [Pholiota conissans]
MGGRARRRRMGEENAGQREADGRGRMNLTFVSFTPFSLVSSLILFHRPLPSRHCFSPALLPSDLAAHNDLLLL